MQFDMKLPLTEEGDGGPARVRDMTLATVAAIVDEFYAKCRVDPTLGPVFEAQVKDWPEHLERIRAFWGAALFKQGGYAGRPLEAHLAIPGLHAGHFAVWLRLFGETVRKFCSERDAAVMMTLAGRMANRMRAAQGEA